MTWEIERLKAGRRRFRVVELDLDFCQLTYSEAPCTAVLGTSGDHKCFNTRVTCQDPDNYDPAAKTYRFCDPISDVPRLFDAIPSLRKVDTAPTVIDPGNSLGKRASVTAEFQDHPHHDRGVDNYFSGRISGAAAADGSTYQPFEQGTYFGKMRARNPYYAGRLMHVLTGYLPWDYSVSPEQQPSFTQAAVLTNLRRQTFVMEKWEGPNDKGSFKIEAKDILKLASDERAECPVQNTGRLSGAITDAGGSATLVPAGIGNSEYAASGTIRIDQELMTFTRAADVLTLTARATDGTTAAAHAADAQVQECKRFAAVRIDAILQDLLENFAGISASFIPIANWQAEAADWLSGHIFNAVIVEPTGVATLVNELCQQAVVYLWWDEIDQQIKFRAVRPQKSAETITGDNAILEKAFSRKDRPANRLSQVIVYFGRASPIDRLDDPTSYRQSFAATDAAAESSNEYGESRIRRIFSRWFDSNDRALALILAHRIIAKYRDDPIEYQLRLGAKNADLWTGDVFTIQHRLSQGFRGEELLQRVQVLEVREDEDGEFRYKLINDLFGNRYGFIGPDTLGEYGAATVEEKNTYGWIALNTGLFGDGTDAYRIS